MEPGKDGLAELPGKLKTGKGDPPPGLFAHLAMLEAKAHQESVEQEQKEQQEEKLALLKSRVQKLRLQRDELRDKLELWEKGHPGKLGTASVSDPPHPGAVLEWRIRSLKSLLQVFHLTGISGKLSKHRVCFTLSTSYGHSQLESFHLELLLWPQVRIQRHSIPSFIPLERLSKEFLHSDLRRFLAELSRHLNGYAGRRFQVEQIQEHFSDQIQGIPRRNSLYNLLTFSYGVSRNSRTFPLRARLLYRDPTRILPTQAEVSCSPDAPASLAATASDHSELFRHLALPEAFQAFSNMDVTP